MAKKIPVMGVIDKLLTKIPLVYFVAAPIVGTAVFFLSLLTNPQIETTYDIVFRFGLYLPLAVADTVVFGGKIKLCKRTDDPDGRVTVWLTTVTYAWGCFALTMWGVVLLIAINSFHFSLFEWSNGIILRGFSFGFVGVGTIGQVIAAVVLIIGFRRDLLGRLIQPWPFSRTALRREERG